MRRILVLLTAAAVATSACGTRVSPEEQAAVRASRAEAAAAAGPASEPAGVDAITAPSPVPDAAAAGAPGTAGSSGSPTATAPASPMGSGAAAPAPLRGTAGTGRTGSAVTRSPRTDAASAPRPGRQPAAVRPGDSSGNQPAAPGAPALPAQKSPIAIGQVGVLSGPIGANMKAIADGVRIWVRSINDRGGLAGHAVTLLQGDSGADPARHRALVQQFVEQKNVVAFVGQPGDVFSGGGSVDYLTKAGVAVVGSEGGASWYYQSPVYFPQMTHGRVMIQALAIGTSDEMIKRKQTKLALWTCVEAQACKDVAEVFPKVLPKKGLAVAHHAQVSIGQPDFTAECLNADNTGADAIALFADAATIMRGAASCARQGYKPTWVIFGAEISPDQHAKDPNLNGAIIIDLTAPWFLSNAPARKEFVDAAARYAPGLPAGPGMSGGWVAGKVLETTAAKVTAPLTRAAVLQALGGLHGDVLADLTGPLLFAVGKPATPSACVYVATTANGRWVSPDDGKRHCFNHDPSL